MKTLFIVTTTALLFTYQFLFSQNLVPNPSFEIGTDICTPTQNADSFGMYAYYWVCPTLGTSDVFSIVVSDTSCFSSQPNSGGIPDHIGTQLPRTGKRFAGIITYYNASSNDSIYREYIQVTLKEKLIPGDYYCTEMYVSRADNAFVGCNNLGMLFTENPTLTVDPLFHGILYNTPQIIEKKIIMDTLNWVRISGTFQAKDSIQFLTIGNFSSTYNTNILNQYTHAPDEADKGMAYYFIDDVSVEHLPKKELIPPLDQEICKGDSVTLMIPGFDDVTWTTLQDTVTVLHSGGIFKMLPDTTTQYRITIKNCNLTIRDTVRVNVDLFLNVKLGPDTTICQGSTLSLDAGTLLGSAYQWQDNSADRYFTAHEAGTYSVSVSNPFNDCVGHDAIDVSILNPPGIDLGKDTLVCQDFFPLKAGSGYSSYSWSTGSSDSIFTPQNAGNYWVTVKNRCGQATDSINVFSPRSIFVPNIVTQNNDPYNNDFRIAVKNNDDQLDLTLPVEGKLTIYNRWGQEIFSDNQYVHGWPGERTDLESGVYYVTFSHSTCPAVKGWVQVMK